MDSFTRQMMNRATSRRVEFEQHLKEILTVDEGIDDPNLEDFLENKRREYREILKSGRRRSEENEDENSGESDYYEREEGIDDEKENFNDKRPASELNSCNIVESNDVPLGRLSTQRSKRLARLANVINNWEDESDKKLPVVKRNEASSSAVKPIVKPQSSPALKKKMVNFEKQPVPQTKGKTVLDERVIQNLEMQGFQRCDSDQQKLVFDYKSPPKTPKTSSPVKMSPKKVFFGGSPHNSPTKSPMKIRDVSNFENTAKTLMKETLPVKVKSPVIAAKSPIRGEAVANRIPGESVAKRIQNVENRGNSVMNMAAKYENDSSPVISKAKDPAELSLAERKAIFERNHGGAILPKAPFGMSLPAKMQNKVQNVEVKREIAPSDAVVERQQEIEMLRTRWQRKREENVMLGGPKAQMPPEYRHEPRPIQQTLVPEVIPEEPESPVHQVRQSISPQRTVEEYTSPRRTRTVEEYASPRRTVEEYTSPRRIEVSPEVRSSPKKSPHYVGNNSIRKRIRVSPPKGGRIYPSISDIETESEFVETESEAVETDMEHQRMDESADYETDDSSSSLGQMVIRRARLSQVNLKRGMATSSPRSSSSSSLNTSAAESRILHEMDDFLDEALGGASPPKRSRESLHEIEPERPKPTTPLVHTVSTYRKMEAQRVPKMEICDVTIDRKTVEEVKIESVQEKIAELEGEMIKQMTIISQASQALNLCLSRPEFVGSTEQVEAEKLLLLATSRRVAAQHEVERLKVERTLNSGASKDKGSLTIEYISLPIKMCPTEPDKTDYFMCVATSGVAVHSTQVLALKKQNLSRGNRLAFVKPIVFENLSCDFAVTIEVFRLTCKNPGVDSGPSDGKEDKKSTLATKLGLTPQKKCPKSRHRLTVESPGGPNIVRTPSFKMVGFVVFSLRDVRKNKFTLNKVPYGVCLDGTVELSMSSALKSEIEYRGFLTQFEEVSGFGAWKRKWAHLKGSAITFWLYPEHEEQNKIPIDTIDLSIVKNKEISLVSREVCARPHTVSLETYCGEQKLLSADTLEDRLAWTKAINKSLQLVKAWGGRPY